MGDDGFRTHVVLPREIVEAVDRLVGHRRRSKFMADAIEEKLRREQLRRALQETAGSVDVAEYPAWSTPDKISEWVRELRSVDDAATERVLRGSCPQ